MTPIKAIRAKCLECAGGRPSLVRKCDSAGCPLHHLRSGHNPARKGIGNHRVQETSNPVLKKVISTHESEDGTQPMKKDALPGDPGLKSPPNEKIAFSGKGGFWIEKTGEGFSIRLREEE